MSKKSLILNFKDLFSWNKKLTIIVIIGLIGIFLIGISGLFSSKPNESSGSRYSSNDEETDTYIAKLEAQVQDLVSSVNGVGKTKVMVTLENGIEYVYEKEETVTSSLNQDTTQSSGEKLQQNEDSKTNIIIVEDSNGNKTALIKKIIQPKIKGVVVVCDGGNNSTVVANIYSVITTALNIGYDRVCVTKKTN